jgi:2-polyprenyl-3-methyl-5-hydroxy-6-metoxy-1,4-benzoquinol methylase
MSGTSYQKIASIDQIKGEDKLMSARNYDNEFQDTDSHKYAYEFDEVLRQFMIREFSHFVVGDNVLEMGCFEGDFTKYLAKQYANVHVLEASTALSSVAKNKLPANVSFTVSTFEEATLDTKFDGIFIVHTLEHLDNPVEILKKTQSWLKVGGRIVIAVPNASAPSRQIAVKMGILEHNSVITDSEWKQGHRITYSMDTLVADVRKSGYKILRSGGVFFKSLANFQYDAVIKSGIVGSEFLEASYQFGMHYPELCASIYVVCELEK